MFQYDVFHKADADDDNAIVVAAVGVDDVVVVVVVVAVVEVAVDLIDRKQVADLEMLIVLQNEVQYGQSFHDV